MASHSTPNPTQQRSYSPPSRRPASHRISAPYSGAEGARQRDLSRQLPAAAAAEVSSGPSSSSARYPISGRRSRVLSEETMMPISMYKKQNSLGTPVHRTNPFDSDSDSEVPSRPSRARSVPAQRTDQSVQELEQYAVIKAEQTSSKVNDCVRAAEAIREDATQTLMTLQRQGEQIMYSHQIAADIERDLSVSEKLLGSLGGLFSKTWRPKRNQQIKGPVSQNNSSARTVNHMEERQRLGIGPRRQECPSPVHQSPATTMEKIHTEKAKQDDALSDLSNMLGQLKGMALDMGTEIERQNKALDGFSDDVDELNFRVKGANQRGRRLLGKR